MNHYLVPSLVKSQIVAQTLWADTTLNRLESPHNHNAGCKVYKKPKATSVSILYHHILYCSSVSFKRCPCVKHQLFIVPETQHFIYPHFVLWVVTDRDGRYHPLLVKRTEIRFVTCNFKQRFEEGVIFLPRNKARPLRQHFGSDSKNQTDWSNVLRRESRKKIK